MILLLLRSQCRQFGHSQVWSISPAALCSWSPYIHTYIGTYIDTYQHIYHIILCLCIVCCIDFHWSWWMVTYHKSSFAITHHHIQYHYIKQCTIMYDHVSSSMIIYIHCLYLLMVVISIICIDVIWFNDSYVCPSFRVAFNYPCRGRLRKVYQWILVNGGGKCELCWVNDKARWWFQIFFMFIPTWGNDPFWLIFFRWVETTNQ